MFVVVGESLLYEASRVMREEHRLSYYQYRALCSFAEMLVLHDKALVVAGVERDADFLEAVSWLKREIETTSDYVVQLIGSADRDEYVDKQVIQLFEAICKEIYQQPLSLVTAELLEKQRKDRTSEDMSERVEHLFSENYPTQQDRRFVDELLRVWSRNATSSELHYFFRAHLFQAIAENADGTSLFENQRLIADILHQIYRKSNKSGTLGYGIYSLVDGLFRRVCETLPHDKSEYPRASLLVSDLVARLEDRSGLLSGLLSLRDEFKPFREHYRITETALLNQDTSLFERSEIQAQLQETVTKVWVPTISSLGRGYSSGNIRKFLKNVFGKYGFGDITVEHSEKQGAHETADSISYASSHRLGHRLGAVGQRRDFFKLTDEFTEPRSALVPQGFKRRLVVRLFLTSL